MLNVLIFDLAEIWKFCVKKILFKFGMTMSKWLFLEKNQIL